MVGPVRWSFLNSPRLGPVIYVNEHRIPIGFPFHVITATGRAGNSEPIVGAGGAIDRQRAFAAAIAETVERLTIHRPTGALLEARIRDLGDDIVLPSDLLHYRDDVYSTGHADWRPFDVSDRITWALGESLKTRSPTWVPAFAVFTYPGGDLPPPDTPVSTGAAVSTSREGAILAGLLEVIERDAFTIHWENRWPGELYPVPDVWSVVRAAKTAKVDITLTRLHTDVSGVFVALAIVRDASGRRAEFSVGAAARLSWETAGFRAIEEALLTMSWMTLTSRRGDQKEFRRLQAEMNGPARPESHAALYASWGYSSRAEFFTRSSLPVAASNVFEASVPAKGLGGIVSTLVSLGYDPVFVDLGTPDLICMGLHAVRVIIPGFAPLGRGLLARPLGNKRLVHVAERFGQPALTPAFNPDPHPFP